MENGIDVKSFLIGLLLCVCTMLIVSAVWSKDTGRYQLFQFRESALVVIDVQTGIVKRLTGTGGKLHQWGISFEEMIPDPMQQK